MERPASDCVVAHWDEWTFLSKQNQSMKQGEPGSVDEYREERPYFYSSLRANRQAASTQTLRNPLSQK